MARTLDGMHELPLVPGTCSCDAFGDDLALLGDESLQFLLVLVVDVLFLGGAEPAYALLSGDLAVPLAPLSSLWSLVHW